MKGLELSRSGPLKGLELSRPGPLKGLEVSRLVRWVWSCHGLVR